MEFKEELITLINEFNNGKKDSFVQIINLVKDSVYRTIFAFVGNEENSIDVFDEVVYKSRLYQKEKAGTSWRTCGNKAGNRSKGDDSFCCGWRLPSCWRYRWCRRRRSVR